MQVFSCEYYEILTLSDTAFLGFKNTGGEAICFPHPNISTRATNDVQTWSVVSPAAVEFIKIFRTMSRPRPLDLNVIVYLKW